MKIKITASDIENGIRRNGFKCPVFLAAKRANLGVTCANIHMLEFDGTTIKTSPELQQWMKDFDAGEKVKPGVFEI